MTIGHYLSKSLLVGALRTEHAHEHLAVSAYLFLPRVYQVPSVPAQTSSSDVP